MQKAPDKNIRGKLFRILKVPVTKLSDPIWNICHTTYVFFSHPDYTVGSGFTPDQLLSQVTDCLLFRSEDQNHRRSGIYIAVSPCPEEFLILFTQLLYAFTLELSIPVSEKNYPFSFIVSWIRCFFRSTLMTFTSTISPTLTTSNGCLMNLSLIWEMCTSPS